MRVRLDAQTPAKQPTIIFHDTSLPVPRTPTVLASIVWGGAASFCGVLDYPATEQRAAAPLTLDDVRAVCGCRTTLTALLRERPIHWWDGKAWGEPEVRDLPDAREYYARERGTEWERDVVERATGEAGR